jgi:DNA-binding NtrC family response regulator
MDNNSSVEGRSDNESPQALHRGACLVLVDDDVDHTSSLERILIRKGIATRSFTSVDQAINSISVEPLVSVLCDAHMPDGGAERLLQLLSAQGQKVRFAVMSGEVNDTLLYRFAALGAREFFSKPIEVEELVAWARADDSRGSALSVGEGKVAC